MQTDLSLLIYFLLPVIALIIILIWGVLLLRGGKPFTIRMAGLGVKLDISSNQVASKPESK